MKTDIYCEIQCQPHETVLATALLDTAFEKFRAFAERYSRFKAGNDLWHLNHSATQTVSEEFFRLLEKALFFYEETAGLFDPSILRSIEHEGYTGAYSSAAPTGMASFQDFRLDPENLTVTKPAALWIDLGGIGKGFIVDQVFQFLHKHFENVLVDAGGDIRCSGANRVDDYPYWAIGLEDPHEKNSSLATLLLANKAVATSGSNRRSWKREGKVKTHLIDPRTGESTRSDLHSVTVIADDTTAADVWAKTLFLLGREEGFAQAEKRRLPAFFVTLQGETVLTEIMQSYVWKEA